MTTMEWRECPTAPGYTVSECGDLRNRRGQRLRGFVNQDGYVTYALLVGGVHTCATAHRLVAMAFLGPAPSARHEVAHNNGSRLDCRRENLRWATRRENDADTQAHGTARIGEKNGRAKITAADVLRIRQEYRAVKERRSLRSLASLEREYGLHRATMLDIAKGRTWRHITLGQETRRWFATSRSRPS